MGRILIVGGADTGRAPMAAALLRRLLVQRGWDATVESAGVLAHIDDEPDREAKEAMLVFDLDLHGHRARMLDDAIMAPATVVIAVDSGIMRIIRMRFPTVTVRIISLGELANQQRNIPDPSRMPLGAWLVYAREIEALLQQGLETLHTFLSGSEPPPAPVPVPPSAAAPAAPPLPAERRTAIERIERLLTTVAELPEIIDWARVRQQIEEALRAAGELPLAADEPVRVYTALLIGSLAMAPVPPTAAWLATMRTRVGRLRDQVDMDDLRVVSVA